MTEKVENTEDSASFEDRLMAELDTVESPEVAEDAPINDIEVKEEGEQVEDVPTLDPLEAPEFFSAEHKEYFKQLQEMENGRPIAENWLNQYQENQKYITKKSQSLAEEKRQYEQQLQEYNQYQQALQPISEIWQRQGIAPSVGVAQMAYYGQLLHTDPQALINEVAKFAGIDLNQVVEDQPYIDPAIQSQLRNLEQQNQQLQQYTVQQQQQAQQQQQQAINEQIQVFVSETDDKGQPLRPYLQESSPHKDAVGQYMAGELTKQFYPAKDMAEAYERAVNNLPELRQEVLKMQEAEQAKARQAEVEKAKKASVKVNSKSKEAPQIEESFEDRLMANLEGI